MHKIHLKNLNIHRALPASDRDIYSLYAADTTMVSAALIQTKPWKYCKSQNIINENHSLTSNILCVCVCVCRAEDSGHDAESQWSPEPKSLHASPSSSTAASHHAHCSYAHHKLQPVTPGQWCIHGKQPWAKVTGEPWAHAFMWRYICLYKTTLNIYYKCELEKQLIKRCLLCKGYKSKLSWSNF